MVSSSENVFINSEQLVAIAKSIQSKKEQIMNIYRNEVVPALQSSESCLSVSGLNYSDIINTFNKGYNAMDSRLSSLTDVLINKIAPNYNAVAMSIRDYFNSEFASEMQTLLHTMNKEIISSSTHDSISASSANN